MTASVSSPFYHDVDKNCQRHGMQLLQYFDMVMQSASCLTLLALQFDESAGRTLLTLPPRSFEQLCKPTMPNKC